MTNHGELFFNWSVLQVDAISETPEASSINQVYQVGQTHFSIDLVPYSKLNMVTMATYAGRLTWSRLGLSCC